MGEIVNLRRHKRRRDKAAAAEQAGMNRARHGRTAAEALRDANEAARARALLDGARLEPDERPAGRPTGG